MGLPERLSAGLEEHPGTVMAAVAGVVVLTVPVIMGADVFISVYDLSPREEYYEHFRVLNAEMGWDNLGAILMTRPDDKAGQPVTDPDAVRMMNEVEKELEQLEFVRGAYSLAEIVRIMNDRPRFALEDTENRTGAPLLPDPVKEQAREESGFPGEGAGGDERINASLEIALETLGDQIYGKILAEDHQSALTVVVMEKGADGPTYREWQNTLKEEGLALEGSVDYGDQLELRPLSIDIIYSTLDDVTIEESPDWVLAAAAVGAVSMLALFHRIPEASFGLLVLLVVASGTLAAAMTMGIDLNLLSLMVATLIFAAGIDYAMHVVSRYREERKLGFDARSSAATTIRALGPALLITTVTDTAGFATLYFSLIPAIGRFGAMVAVGLFLCFLTCLVMLPALLMWADQLRGTSEGEDVPEEELERRREQLHDELREEQRTSWLGRMGATLADNPLRTSLAVLVAIAAVASPMATHGVKTWGASYLEPEPILDEDTYAIQSLRAMDETFGIPNELAVMFYGDPTQPEAVDYLDEVQTATNDTHGLTSVDSVPNMLRLYTTIINPDPTIDEDGDGIPDTQEDIQQAFDDMREDPATEVLIDRVVLFDPGHPNNYSAAAHRMSIDPQPEETLGRDIENYRASVNQTEAALADLEDEQRDAGFEERGSTGLTKLGVEVVDAIKRGNLSTITIMLGVVFGLLAFFYRSPMIGAIGMVPIFSAVAVQYGLTSLLGYEVTYVSLILTGMVMGIGVDDAVHYLTRFREEIREGTPPREAASLASAEIGSVLTGTTVTTLSPFIVVMFSIVTWAAQTALLVIPTLIAALLGTLIPMPALLAWHAERDPTPYLRGTLFDDAVDPEETEADAAAEAA